MPCGTMHQGQAGQTFRIQVTGGLPTVEAFLTSFNPSAPPASTTRFTDAQLRAGQTIPITAGCSYHLLIRRTPAAGQTNVRFTAPSGNVTNCSSQGPTVGTWLIFA